MFFVGNAVSMQPTTDKKTEIDSLLSRAKQCQLELNLLSGFEYAVKASTLSEKINYSKGKTTSYLYIAQILCGLGDYNKTLKYLKLAEKEKYLVDNPQLHSELHRIRGRAYGSMDLYQASIQEFKKGEKYIKFINEEKKRNYLQSQVYENLSFIYSKQNKSDSAIYFLNKNRELIESMDESFVYRNKINLYSMLGMEYSAHEQYDSTHYYLNQALSLCHKYEYPYTSWIYQKWGQMEELRGNHDGALEYYYKGLENLSYTGIKNELLDTYISIADIYLQKGETDSFNYYREKIDTLKLELASVNANVLDNALQILIEEEQTKNIKRVQKIILAIGIFTSIVLIFIFIWWIVTTKRHKKLISKKENEVVELEKKINDDSAKNVIKLAMNNDNTFLNVFNEVYPNFFPALNNTCPNLIGSELQFCALIYLNFSSKDIASILYVEHRSVQIRKSRLRKKLNIDSDTDLHQFMKSLDKQP
jgi:tetratricopeptide (TPR) repeat protein